jgi:hypothetical protein
MVARVQFPCLPSCRDTIPSPPRATIKALAPPDRSASCPASWLSLMDIGRPLRSPCSNASTEAKNDGATVGAGGVWRWVGTLVVARVLLPWLSSCRNTIPSPPTGDHKGPHSTQLHPRPYEYRHQMLYFSTNGSVSIP